MVLGQGSKGKRQKPKSFVTLMQTYAKRNCKNSKKIQLHGWILLFEEYLLDSVSLCILKHGRCKNLPPFSPSFSPYSKPPSLFPFLTAPPFPLSPNPPSISPSLFPNPLPLWHFLRRPWINLVPRFYLLPVGRREPWVWGTDQMRKGNKVQIYGRWELNIDQGEAYLSLFLKFEWIIEWFLDSAFLL